MAKLFMKKDLKSTEESNISQLEIVVPKKSFRKRYLSLNNHFFSILVGLIFAGVFCAGAFVLATDWPYAPGATTTPGCVPGTSGCTVISPVPYTGATGSVNLGNNNFVVSGSGTGNTLTANANGSGYAINATGTSYFSNGFGSATTTLIANGGQIAGEFVSPDGGTAWLGLYGGGGGGYGGYFFNATQANTVYISGNDYAINATGAFNMNGVSAPAVSGTGAGTIYFDSGSNTFKVSQNGGAYVDLVGGGGSSLWTQSAGTLFPTTTSNRVLLGGAADDGSSILRVKGTSKLGTPNYFGTNIIVGDYTTGSYNIYTGIQGSILGDGATNGGVGANFTIEDSGLNTIVQAWVALAGLAGQPSYAFEGFYNPTRDVNHNSAAGYFNDGANSVKLANGTYAINATGDSTFSGYIALGGTTDGYKISTAPIGSATQVHMYIGNREITTAAPSDFRIKENIVNTNYGLSDLMNLSVKNFTYKKQYVDEGATQLTHTGLIAQDLEQIFPQAVVEPPDPTNPDEFKSIDYAQLTPLLIKSIQDLQTEFKTGVAITQHGTVGNGQVSGITQQGLTASLFNVGISITNSIVNIASLAVDNLNVKTAQVQELQMVAANGDVYCTWLDASGNWQKAKGGCADVGPEVTNVTTTATPATTPTPTPTPTPVSNPFSSSPSPSPTPGSQNGTLNIVSVAPISEIDVAYGTALASTNLPNTVVATMSDGTTQSVAVTWDTGMPSYDQNTAGTYVFSGTLATSETLTNTNNLTASVDVVMAAPVVSASPTPTPSPSPDVVQQATSALLNGIWNLVQFIVITPLKFISASLTGALNH